MLVNYYSNDNKRASFEDFSLGLQNVWAALVLSLKYLLNIKFFYPFIFVSTCTKVIFHVLYFSPT